MLLRRGGRKHVRATVKLRGHFSGSKNDVAKTMIHVIIVGVRSGMAVYFRGNDMNSNPWAQIPPSMPFVLPDDDLAVKCFNAKAKEQHRLMTNLGRAH
jgi:hypothetical protein